MKVLHTSDWHLGRTLEGTSLLEDQAHVLNQILEISRSEEPNVVIIAGDVFDRSVPPADAIELFDEVIFKLVVDQGRQVIVIAGNHDSPERVKLHNRILAKHNLHVAGSLELPFKSVSIKDEHGEVRFLVVPYTEPEMYRYLSLNEDIKTHQNVFDSIVGSIEESQGFEGRHVLIAHAFVAGGTASESERMLAVGGAECVNSDVFKPFSYVAMGHLHTPQNIPNGKIHYSGSFLKSSLSEISHSKSVTLSTIDATGEITQSMIPLNPKRDMHRITGQITDGVFQMTAGEVQPAKEDFLQVVLTNEQPVLDAMRIVQELYPNTLALDWQRKQTQNDQVRSFTSSTVRQRNPFELFEEFYSFSTGAELTEAGKEAVHEVIQDVEKGAQ